MYIVGPGTGTYRFESSFEEDQTNQVQPGPMQQQASAGDPPEYPPEDPMDALIEELREEFKRGLVRQAAQKEAVRHKRRVVLTCLLGPGLILAAAALIGKAIHSRVEAPRHEVHYGH